VVVGRARVDVVDGDSLHVLVWTASEQKSPLLAAVVLYFRRSLV